MDLDIIYERIRERRKALHMTQVELAQKVGYADHTTIVRIEKGLVDLPQSRVIQFAEALDTTVDYLMGFDVMDSRKEVIMLLDRLTDDELRTVLTLLRQMTAGREGSRP